MDMFKKPKCKNCDEKISKKYTFCPHCGHDQAEEGAKKFFEPEFKLGFPFNKLFKELEKQLERQFQEMDSQMSAESFEGFTEPKGFSINIDTTNGNPTIRIKQMDENGSNKIEQPHRHTHNNVHNHHNHNKHDHSQHRTPTKMDEARVEKFSNLPREEPNTKVRRLTNKLIYEINLPGVKNEDVMISKLENSIEVKAFSEDKAFFKLIPLSLPIICTELKEGILNLELKL